MTESSPLSAALVTVLLTIAVYQGAVQLQKRLPLSLLNPVLVSVSILILLLLFSGFPYETYAKETRGLSFMLGPATVALAVPLYRQLENLRRDWQAIVAGSLIGAITGIGSVLLLAKLFKAPTEIILSMVPKSVTTPIAMDVASVIGGLPPLTAALVILTGILGAVIGPQVLTLLRIKDETARGLAVGAAAHALGTSWRSKKANAKAP
jgi:predicted murein hydrolase (TIGR00659 family)